MMKNFKTAVFAQSEDCRFIFSVDFYDKTKEKFTEF